MSDTNTKCLIHSMVKRSVDAISEMEAEMLAVNHKYEMALGFIRKTASLDIEPTTFRAYLIIEARKLLKEISDE